MHITKGLLLQVVKKALIILIFILISNFFIASIYFLVVYNDSELSGWLTLGRNILIYLLAIYLIQRNNLIGDLILFYMIYVNLQLEYYLGGYYGIHSFLIGPQAMFSDIVELVIFIFATTHCLFIILKKIKPSLFAFNYNLQKSASIKRYKVDFILAIIFSIFIIFYWSFWFILSHYQLIA